MFRFMATVVLVTFVPSVVFAGPLASWRPSAAFLSSMQVSACADSRAQGRKDSSARHGSMGWFAGGIAAGAGAGLIGVGVLTAVSAVGKPQPEDVPPVSDENCYREGYSRNSRGKNVKSAFLGSLLGTGAFLAILAARNSD